MAAAIPCPPRGIYVPAVAFFNPDETIDFDAIRAHLTRLAKGGVDGLVIQSSNGEAMHMLHDERQQVLRLAREVLNEHVKPGYVIVAGCGVQVINSRARRETTPAKANNTSKQRATASSWRPPLEIDSRKPLAKAPPSMT